MTLITQIFKSKFNQKPQVIINAPGRINLMGEHTDYNGGWVMPAAIDLSIQFALSNTNKGFSIIYSEEQKETLTIHHNSIQLSEVKWQNYFIGVVDLLQKDLHQKIPHFQLAFTGNIPLGAGLSSSAALTCGFISGLNTLFDLDYDKWKIAQLAQQCEHQYIGVQCGIMDQFAVMFGEENGALQLNCETLEYQSFQFNLKEYQFLLCNSMVSHNLAESAYNQRRAVCESALQLFNKNGKNYKNLSEATLDDLLILKDHNEMFHFTKHVLSENENVKLLSKALQNENFENAGKLINASHESLKDDYQVTCSETDFLYREINEIEGVAGCRQMGGGFGGCMLILMKKEVKSILIRKVSKASKLKFNKELEFYAVHLSAGLKSSKIN